MMWKMIVKANCSRETRTGSRSIGLLLFGKRPLGSFGRCRRWELLAWAGTALRQLLFQPQIVMFLGPVVIDLAGPHGLEGALHPKRADIDVTKDQRDEQDRDDGVHPLRDLHPEDVGDVEGKQEQIAGNGNQDAHAKRAPEYELLAGIEPA